MEGSFYLSSLSYPSLFLCPFLSSSLLSPFLSPSSPSFLFLILKTSQQIQYFEKTGKYL
jgi:hypothetical protein